MCPPTLMIRKKNIKNYNNVNIITINGKNDDNIHNNGNTINSYNDSNNKRYDYYRSSEESTFTRVHIDGDDHTDACAKIRNVFTNKKKTDLTNRFLSFAAVVI